jgi:putative N6-adenine-specific DNA methylase
MPHLSTNSYSYFCPCPRHLESALAEELNEIAQLSSPIITLKVQSQVPGGVHCSGLLKDAWLINLHSRIASRVLLFLAKGTYKNEDDVYNITLRQEWESWFSVDNTIRVNITAIRSPLNSLKFTTLRIKDGVCDRFRSIYNKRPSVDTFEPDMRISGFLDSNNFTLYIDTSGDALFKRGWRTETGDAPLRENLAAGLLRVAGWKPGIALFDPMCGSGTILIEAAQIVAGIPSGFLRHFAFEKFRDFESNKWEVIKGSIENNPPPTVPTIFGSDISGDMVRISTDNLRNAGIRFEVPIKQIEAQEVKQPLNNEEGGIILTNPPYSERISLRGDSSLNNDELLSKFFSAFATILKRRFAGWKAFVFSADLGLPGLLRLKERYKTPFSNGPLECRLFRFDIVLGTNRRIKKK